MQKPFQLLPRQHGNSAIGKLLTKNTYVLYIQLHIALWVIYMENFCMSNLSDTKTFSSFTMMWVMHMPTEII